MSNITVEGTFSTDEFEKMSVACKSVLEHIDEAHGTIMVHEFTVEYNEKLMAYEYTLTGTPKVDYDGS